MESEIATAGSEPITLKKTELKADRRIEFWRFESSVIYLANMQSQRRPRFQIQDILIAIKGEYRLQKNNQDLSSRLRARSLLDTFRDE